tara:strand:+ start:66 stop:365 length:300 start_codon:yes stop_codon:yes gene_type:complete
MNTYTELEVITYNAILNECDQDIGATIKQIVRETNKTANVLRGVLSSLIKKGKIVQHVIDGENFKDIIVFTPCEGNTWYTFGGESITEKEFSLFVKLIA